MTKCSIEGCNLPARKRGWCENHYMRWYRKGSTDLKPTNPRVLCSVDGCVKYTTHSHGLCIAHYKQQWYLKKVGRTELIQRTSQERWVHIVTGYIMIKVNGKLVYEHRHIAERALGKPLPRGVVVHHTKARDDNHGPFKLVICPNQEYHVLLHKRMEELGYANN